MRDPDSRCRSIISNINARSLGQMVQKCLEADSLGYQIFNVSNDYNSVSLRSAELIKRCYNNVCMRSSNMPENFYSNEKAKRLLGFIPAHSWRNYL